MTGKEKCEFLRTIRVNMAAKNGIPYTPKECYHEGDCMGTCPLCELEAKELMGKIQCKLDADETIIIDSDSVNKLVKLYENQGEELLNNQESNDENNHYPEDKEQHYGFCLAGDVSCENE
jgi:hypothetical protein